MHVATLPTTPVSKIKMYNMVTGISRGSDEAQPVSRSVVFVLVSWVTVDKTESDEREDESSNESVDGEESKKSPTRDEDEDAIIIEGGDGEEIIVFCIKSLRFMVITIIGNFDNQHKQQ